MKLVTDESILPLLIVVCSVALVFFATLFYIFPSDPAEPSIIKNYEGIVVDVDSKKIT